MRREELVQQVMVGTVEFYTVEPGFDSSNGRLFEVFDDFFNFVIAQFARRFSPVFSRGDGTGS